MKKKLFSLLLSLAMVVTMMPVMTMTAYADVETNVDWVNLGKALAGESISSNAAFEVTDSGNIRTIKLLQSIAAGSEDTCLEVADTIESIILDLNNCTLNRNLNDNEPDGNVITVKKDAKLTIDDTSSTKEGKITGGFNSHMGGGGGIVVNGGSLIMNGGCICDNKTKQLMGAGVFVCDGSFIMNGGCIKSNSIVEGESDSGAGVVITKNENPSTFTMNGGSIINNRATQSSVGGVYIDNGCTFTMTGGLISGNTANHDAGGIGVSDGGELIFCGTAVVMGNKVQDEQSDVYCNDGGKVSIAHNVDDEPQNGMFVGVYEMSNEVVTNAREGDEKYFFANHSNFYVSFNNNDSIHDTEDDYLELVNPESGENKINAFKDINTGTVYTEPQAAREGGEVKLTIAPNEGYYLKSLKINDNAVDLSDVVDTYIFTMPNQEVTLTPVFVKVTLIDEIDLSNLLLGKDWAGKSPEETESTWKNLSIDNCSYVRSIIFDKEFSSFDSNFVEGETYWLVLVFKTKNGYEFKSKLNEDSLDVLDGDIFGNDTMDSIINKIGIPQDDYTGFYPSNRHIAFFIQFSVTAEQKKPKTPKIIIPEMKNCTVHFDMNGHGDDIHDKYVVSGYKIHSKPDTPTSEGYVFCGWYKDSFCTHEWNWDADIVTSDMTLYAKWISTDIAKTSIKSLKAGKKSFTVKVKKIAEAEKYQVRYSLKKNMKSSVKKSFNIGKVSKTVKKLKAKKIYYVQVRTLKRIEGKTYYSGWSKAKKVRTK